MQLTKAHLLAKAHCELLRRNHSLPVQVRKPVDYDLSRLSVLKVREICQKVKFFSD
jgi:hypothetical protein